MALYACYTREMIEICHLFKPVDFPVVFVSLNPVLYKHFKQKCQMYGVVCYCVVKCVCAVCASAGWSSQHKG